MVSNQLLLPLCYTVIRLFLLVFHQTRQITTLIRRRESTAVMTATGTTNNTVGVLSLVGTGLPTGVDTQ